MQVIIYMAQNCETTYIPCHFLYSSCEDLLQKFKPLYEPKWLIFTIFHISTSDDSCGIDLNKVNSGIWVLNGSLDIQSPIGYQGNFNF